MYIEKIKGTLFIGDLDLQPTLNEDVIILINICKLLLKMYVEAYQNFKLMTSNHAFVSNVCRRSLCFVPILVHCIRLPWQNDQLLFMGTLIFLGSVENEDPANEDRRRKTHSKTKTHSQNARLRMFWCEVGCHELMGGVLQTKKDQETWKLYSWEIRFGNKTDTWFDLVKLIWNSTWSELHLGGRSVLSRSYAINTPMHESRWLIRFLLITWSN